MENLRITENELVTDIVKKDYHTADIFNRYGIDFCCGGKWPLKVACENRGLDTAAIIKELERSRVRSTAALPDPHSWPTGFLLVYIAEVHHRYQRMALSQASQYLEAFMAGHLRQHPYLAELANCFRQLSGELMARLDEKEKKLFPYIRQVTRIYESRESYTELLLRTLRKPDTTLPAAPGAALSYFRLIRKLTGDYILPEPSCAGQRVLWCKLRELDTDFIQYSLLEYDILYPRLAEMEKALHAAGNQEYRT